MLPEVERCISVSVRSDHIYTRRLTDATKSGVLLDKLEQVEEGNEGVVGGYDQQELERVTVESNAVE